MSDFDLDRLAERVRAASVRSRGLKVSVTNTELVLNKTGYGTGRMESIPFAALFLRDDGLLDQALTRLGVGAYSLSGPEGADPAGPVVTTADAPSMSATPRDIEIRDAAEG